MDRSPWGPRRPAPLLQQVRCLPISCHCCSAQEPRSNHVRRVTAVIEGLDWSTLLYLAGLYVLVTVLVQFKLIRSVSIWPLLARES